MTRYAKAVPSSASKAPRSTRDVLDALRLARGFVAEEVLAAKVGRLRGWFAREGLDAAVVGLSGGIDSAVTLGLLARLAAAPGTPLRRLLAISVPIAAPGATRQSDATNRAGLVARHFCTELWTADFSLAQRQAVFALEQASDYEMDAWSSGQMLSVMRTPALYGAAALLQTKGLRSVVVGTTNRDEGAFLGFFGKASDGMVDVQPISDLHKSEVIAVGEVLGVPRVVVNAVPSGDVWDGRSDAEMIGASYDEVELVLRLRELGLDPSEVARSLADPWRLDRAARAVGALHRANAHKYAVGGWAIHLDVLPRGVPGGWSDEPLAPRTEIPPPDGAVAGAWRPAPLPLTPLRHLPDVERPIPGVTIARGVLREGDLRLLVGAFAQADAAPVDITGVQSSLGTGSMRATAWSPELAADLWNRIRPAVTSVRFLGPMDATDGFATTGRAGHRSWRAVGLSPLLRFMRYDDGGRHLCHYDAAFDYGDGRRTLQSVIFFLAADVAASEHDSCPGGALRFVADGQDHLPVWDRNFDDWDRDTEPSAVRLRVPPTPGDVVIFDHRLGHDVERWTGHHPRVIIRADVVFEAVPDGRTLP